MRRWTEVHQLPLGRRKASCRRLVLGFALDPKMGKRFMEFTDTVTTNNQEKTENPWVPWHQAHAQQV